ncbi:hypothetical protein ATCVNEJV3_267R [Acanthocystis turfacea Chlorella virus NE-JV-3]|nr:hypothetical protein ATCVNEJV3_267R [Acanthocystis turfacea Chlorella virus NE-JV-3]
MKTLKYYWADGTLTTFDNYTIDEQSIIRNKNGQVISQCKTPDGYNRATVFHEGKRRPIFVYRALATTFLGPPPTLRHTVDHEDGNSLNDVLKNIHWLDRIGQAKNRKMPSEYKSSFIIIKDGIEHTAKEWEDALKYETNSYGGKYTKAAIHHYAQRQTNDFRYKTFQNLRGEVWKSIPWSKNKKGEWFISNMNRMKYKSAYAENVMTTDKLHKNDGYPEVRINGKNWSCHELSFMTFRPNEYTAKLPGDNILHKNDDKLDFNPFRLRWGTPPENGKDAHKNGKYDGTKSAQKPVASYIDGILEKKHVSIRDASDYLRANEYPTATPGNVHYALNNDVIRYGRTWKVV